MFFWVRLQVRRHLTVYSKNNIHQYSLIYVAAIHSLQVLLSASSSFLGRWERGRTGCRRLSPRMGSEEMRRFSRHAAALPGSARLSSSCRGAEAEWEQLLHARTVGVPVRRKAANQKCQSLQRLGRLSSGSFSGEPGAPLPGRTASLSLQLAQYAASLCLRSVTFYT